MKSLHVVAIRYEMFSCTTETAAIHENARPATCILVHPSNLTFTHVQLVNMLCYSWYEEYHKWFTWVIVY